MFFQPVVVGNVVEQDVLDLRVFGQIVGRERLTVVVLRPGDIGIGEHDVALGGRGLHRFGHLACLGPVGAHEK